MSSPEKKLTEKKVESFLRKTGFVFEMEVAEHLKKKGWKVDMGSMFLDLDESKKREIDVVASRVIDKTTVYLVIECKQSLQNDWVFIRNKENPSIYYYSVKHLPQVSLTQLNKRNLFDNHHYFQSHGLMCQNYTAVDRNEKRVDPLQINEAIYKLPKALIDVAAATKTKDRTLFLPLVLFSGQVFSAHYSHSLEVKKEDYVQFRMEFESEAYEEEKEKLSMVSHRSILGMDADDFPYSFDFDSKKRKIKSLRSMSKVLGSHYTIDIVSFSGVEQFLSKLEKGVVATSWRKWPLKPRTPKPPKYRPAKF